LRMRVRTGVFEMAHYSCLHSVRGRVLRTDERIIGGGCKTPLNARIEDVKSCKEVVRRAGFLGEADSAAG
ncbi:hypothetical protein, partial [Pseudomonas aeruginosa]|uniref:hypothetical protein n=1 Tax=Pseudomonas aeruginosa TaxID=287 RepID=UPI0024B6DC9C